MADETPSTRDRILTACQRLFNEAGPAAVTTAQIARTVGINEGNLYYYFKKKEDILLALFEQFEATLNSIAGTVPEAADESSGGQAYLRRWFTLMWEWRFFYRDNAAIKRMAPALRQRSMLLADRGQADVKRVLRKMVNDGLLDIPETEFDRLVVNAWIVSSYWLDYLGSRHHVEDITREHVEWGFSQVLGLFAPYVRAPR